MTQQLAKNLFLSNERTCPAQDQRSVPGALARIASDARTKSSSSISTAPISAAARSASMRRPNIISASRCATSRCRKRRCSPACSRRRPNIRRSSICRRRAHAPTSCSTIWSQNGFMTEGQVYGARRNPATPIDRTAEDAPNYYLDYAFDEMRKLVDTFPKSVTDRYFVVRTALDSNLQHYAEHEVESQLRQYGHDYGASQAAAVIRRSRRRHPRHGRRPRLRRQPIQPRYRRAAPARLFVQALCLRHRAGQRLHAQFRRHRLAGLHRQLVSAQLFRRLFRIRSR